MSCSVGTKSQSPELYGLTRFGGVLELGSLYKINGNGTGYTTLFACDTANYSANGYDARENIFWASNNKIYGMFYGGGSQTLFGLSAGTLFSFDPATNTFTKIIDLGPAIGGLPVFNGFNEYNGKLYASLVAGGAYNSGTLISIDLATNQVTNLHDFNGHDGSYPYGTLTFGDDGYFYGVCSTEGSTNSLGNPFGGGSIYQFNPRDNTLLKVFSFLDDAVNSIYTSTNPIAAPLYYHHRLYGVTTTSSGPFVNGAFYCYNLDNDSFYVVNAFSVFHNSQGYGVPLLVGDSIYVVIDDGVAVFDPATSVFSLRYSFTGFSSASPTAGLIQASDGNLYGTLSGEGINNGSIYKIDLHRDSIFELFSFDGTDGFEPIGTLVEKRRFNGIPSPTATSSFIRVSQSPGKVDGWQIETSDDYSGQAFTIYDLHLRQIASSRFNGTSTRVQQDVPPGIYFLRTQGGTEAVTVKLLKE